MVLCLANSSTIREGQPVTSEQTPFGGGPVLWTPNLDLVYISCGVGVNHQIANWYFQPGIPLVRVIAA